MSDTDKSKQIIQNFIQVVWNGRDLSALKDFWAEDCVNHVNNRSLMVLPTPNTCKLLFVLSVVGGSYQKIVGQATVMIEIGLSEMYMLLVQPLQDIQHSLILNKSHCFVTR